MSTCGLTLIFDPVLSTYFRPPIGWVSMYERAVINQSTRQLNRHHKEIGAKNLEKTPTIHDNKNQMKSVIPNLNNCEHC